MAFRVTQVHWELIVNLMQKYPGMAKGRIDGPVGKEKMRKLWEQLTQELNALGLGTRTSEKWKKSWVDFKDIPKQLCQYIVGIQTALNVIATRPGLLDLKGKAKWDSWNSKKGLAKYVAKEQYIAKVQSLIDSIGLA